MIEFLSNDDYVERLDPLLTGVLNRPEGELDWRRPFTDALPYRAILYPLAFALPERVFNELGYASGEARLFLSSLPRFVDPEPIQMDWSLDSTNFAEYQRVGSDPVDQVVYSPRGAWAAVLTDDYGVVGTAALPMLRAIERAAGPLADPRAFVENVRSEAERGGFTISQSWTNELLDHVFGAAHAALLIGDTP